MEKKEVWQAANPSLGLIKTLNYMRAEVQNVIDDPSLLPEFLRLELNVWTETNVGGLDLLLWARQARKYRFEDIPYLRTRPCFAGLDLSCTTDFTALVLCFPAFKDDPEWKLWPHLWCPQANLLLRGQKDDAPYGIWADPKIGFIHPTSGNQIDYETVKETIEGVKSNTKLKEIAFDKWNSTMMVQQLEKSGMLMVDHRQGGPSMSPAIKDFENLLRSKLLVHPDNHCLNWMYGNTAIITDAKDNKSTDKEQSNDRIDGVQAALMAVSSAVGNGHNPYKKADKVLRFI